MNAKSILKVDKTDAEWRAQLTPDQYRITRQHGTERAFSSPDFELGKQASITASAATGRSIARR